jgi:hypothetical protein
MQSLAALQKIPIQKPFEDLTRKQQAILLEGATGNRVLVLSKVLSEEISSEPHDWFASAEVRLLIAAGSG